MVGGLFSRGRQCLCERIEESRGMVFLPYPHTDSLLLRKNMSVQANILHRPSFMRAGQPERSTTTAAIKSPDDTHQADLSQNAMRQKQTQANTRDKGRLTI